jgi:hypothetical protein
MFQLKPQRKEILRFVGETLPRNDRVNLIYIEKRPKENAFTLPTIPEADPLDSEYKPVDMRLKSLPEKRNTGSSR